MLLSVGILGIVAIYVLIYGTSQRHYTVTDPQHNHPQHTSTGDESVSSHQRTIVESEVIEHIQKATMGAGVLTPIPGFGQRKPFIAEDDGSWDITPTNDAQNAHKGDNGLLCDAAGCRLEEPYTDIYQAGVAYGLDG